MFLILNSTFQLSANFLCRGLAPFFFLCRTGKKNFVPGDTLIKEFCIYFRVSPEFFFLCFLDNCSAPSPPPPFFSLFFPSLVSPLNFFFLFFLCFPGIFFFLFFLKLFTPPPPPVLFVYSFSCSDFPLKFFSPFLGSYAPHLLSSQCPKIALTFSSLPEGQISHRLPHPAFLLRGPR